MDLSGIFQKATTAVSDPAKIGEYIRWRARNYRWKRLKQQDEIRCHLADFDVQFNIQDGPVSKSLYFDGIYEPDETALYKDLIQNEMVVADIGANIGYFSILFAKMVGGGTVYSFEPEEVNYGILKDNIKMNSICNVQTENMALSSDTGETNLFKNPTNPGGHSIHRGGVLPFEEFPSEGKVSSVESTTFDKYFSRQDRDIPDFVKIDVEGGEPDVLYGMEDSLQSTPILSIEYAPQLWADDPEGVFDYLLSYGYEFFTIQTGGDITSISKDTILKYDDGWYSILVATKGSIAHIE